MKKLILLINNLLNRKSYSVVKTKLQFIKITTIKPNLLCLRLTLRGIKTKKVQLFKIYIVAINHKRISNLIIN